VAVTQALGEECERFAAAAGGWCPAWVSAQCGADTPVTPVRDASRAAVTATVV
jgi:hypothetical protein